MRSFDIERRGDDLLVRCFGQLTVEVCDLLRRELEGRLDQGGVRLLGMDLSKVRFLDSSAIGMLLALHARVRDTPCAFRLVAPSEEVRNTLALVRLLDFFEIAEDLRDPAQPVD